MLAVTMSWRVCAGEPSAYSSLQELGVGVRELMDSENLPSDLFGLSSSPGEAVSPAAASVEVSAGAALQPAHKHAGHSAHRGDHHKATMRRERGRWEDAEAAEAAADATRAAVDNSKRMPMPGVADSDVPEVLPATAPAAKDPDADTAGAATPEAETEDTDKAVIAGTKAILKNELNLTTNGTAGNATKAGNATEDAEAAPEAASVAKPLTEEEAEEMRMWELNRDASVQYAIMLNGQTRAHEKLAKEACPTLWSLCGLFFVLTCWGCCAPRTFSSCCSCFICMRVFDWCIPVVDEASFKAGKGGMEDTPLLDDAEYVGEEEAEAAPGDEEAS